MAAVVIGNKTSVVGIVTVMGLIMNRKMITYLPVLFSNGIFLASCLHHLGVPELLLTKCLPFPPRIILFWISNPYSEKPVLISLWSYLILLFPSHASLKSHCSFYFLHMPRFFFSSKNIYTWSWGKIPLDYHQLLSLLSYPYSFHQKILSTLLSNYTQSLTTLIPFILPPGPSQHHLLIW